LILVSQFWVYTNSSSDPREMKPICAIIGGAVIFGGLAGGMLATTHRRPRMALRQLDGHIAYVYVRSPSGSAAA
jgi:hypothetical protein